MTARRRAGAALIALGTGFNLPYAALVVAFGYPDVLRLPAGEILTRFAAGGPALVLTWYAFMLAALLMAGAAAALAAAEPERPAATMLGTIGLVAGLLQAIGLSRWVFAVPAIAAAHSDAGTDAAGRAAIEAGFATLHAFAGIAIGEHLGQLLTAAWVAGVAAGRSGARRAVGGATAGLIVIGTGEGLALALGRAGDAFAVATVTGYLLLTAWLMIEGAALFRAAPRAPLRALAAGATPG